jgi:hypothetical protein
MEGRGGGEAQGVADPKNTLTSIHILRGVSSLKTATKGEKYVYTYV